ncbi:MAG: hypothetical protein ABI678_06930 [Kofleriaceae bacterium]
MTKEAFHATLQDSIDSVKESCKLDLVVTSDFEKVDIAAWGGSKGGPPRTWMRQLSQGCSRAIGAIESLCRSNKYAEEWRPVIAREVKSVRCQLEGNQPKRPDQGREAWMQQNVTFANGVLTVLMSPAMPDTEDVAATALIAGLANKPGAPAYAKNITVKSGANGESCTAATAATDCGTRMCSKNVCTPCTAKLKCAKGMQCTDTGACRTPAEIRTIQANRVHEEEERKERAESRANDDAESSAPAASKPAKGSARGRMCSKDKDCASGSCAMENKTRGRCR